MTSPSTSQKPLQNSQTRQTKWTHHLLPPVSTFTSHLPHLPSFGFPTGLICCYPLHPNHLRLTQHLLLQSNPPKSSPTTNKTNISTITNPISKNTDSSTSRLPCLLLSLLHRPTPPNSEAYIHWTLTFLKWVCVEKRSERNMGEMEVGRLGGWMEDLMLMFTLVFW